MDKPSRLGKCWGTREAEPWLGGPLPRAGPGPALLPAAGRGPGTAAVLPLPASAQV